MGPSVPLRFPSGRTDKGAEGERTWGGVDSRFFSGSDGNCGGNDGPGSYFDFPQHEPEGLEAAPAWGFVDSGPSLRPGFFA